jgi:allantoicase
VCIVRLGLPGIIRELVVDTAHFKGNFPKACSFEVASLPDKITTEQILADDSVWSPLVPETDLRGDSKNHIPVNAALRATHLRFHIYPDGGVARLRVFGEVVPTPRALGRADTDQDIDLVAVEHGGRVLACNDMFFGSRHNLLGSGRGANMGDGWETKRSRKEAPDWVIVQLGVEGVVQEAEIDTTHFKGNFPESAALLGLRGVAAGADVAKLPDSAWTELLSRSKLEMHRRHLYDEELKAIGPVSHVKMYIWPDGGVSRLRLRGTPSLDGRMALGMRYLNALAPTSRKDVFYTCCNSIRFAVQLAELGPFASWADLSKQAKDTWHGLEPKDWDEAFAGHPRIGERKSHDLHATREQAGVAHAATETLDALAVVNAEYEKKFGRIYLVFASGKSADEMLALARIRIERTPDEELSTMVEEQAKITELRLRRMLFRTSQEQA